MKHYLSQQYRNAVCKYKKFKARFEKNAEQGLSVRKRRTLAQRLKKLYNQIVRLEAQLKWAVSAGALSLALSTTPITQTFAQDKFAYVKKDLALPPTNFEQTDSPVYPTFADLDNDGDLDLVLGLYGGGVLYYQRNQDENTGKDVFTLIPSSDPQNPFSGVDELNNYGYLSPSFADMDGDGDLDMIVGYGENFSGYVTLFKNVDGSFVPFTGYANPFILVQTYGGLGIGGARGEMIDIGDDGDLDLFVSGNNADKYEIIVRYYENEADNTGVFLQKTGADNPLDLVSITNIMIGSYYAAYASLTFADADDDGDLDAYIGEKYGSVFEYENNGDNTFTDNGPRADLSFSFYYGATITPAFNDLDGDGDLDCLYGDKYLTNLPYALNDGSGNFTIDVLGVNNAADFSFVQPVGSIVVDILSSTAHLDYDGDDDLDFVTFDIYGAIRYFENLGDGEIEEKTGALNPFGAISGLPDSYLGRPVFVDWDGDGDKDLVVGNYYGEILYFRNDAGVFNQQTGASNPFDGIDVGYAAVPQLVDWDGDGDLDLFVGERLSMQLWLNNAGTFVQQTGASDPFADFTVTTNAYYAPKLIDFDDDGDLDLVFGVIDPTSLGFDITKLQYYKNDGTGIFEAVFGSPLDAITVNRVATPDFIDLDGDGDLDLLVGENLVTARVQYYERIGNNFCPKVSEILVQIPVNTTYEFTKEEFRNVYSDEPDTKSKDFPKIKVWVSPSFGELRAGGDLINSGTELSYASLDNLTYTPNNGYTGLDAFAWAAFDPIGQCYSNASYVRFGIGTNVTGLDELNNLVGIYPNPSNGVFNINLDKGLVGKVDIQVYNALGSVVKSYNYNNPNEVEAIDLQAMPKGLYIVRISNQGKDGTIKIVKE